MASRLASFGRYATAPAPSARTTTSLSVAAEINTTRRLRRRLTWVWGASLVFFVLLAASALAVTGALTQLSGTDACVSETGTGGGCADGKALDGPVMVAVTSERKPKSVYTASQKQQGGRRVRPKR
jgi:hypothetical protein